MFPGEPRFPTSPHVSSQPSTGSLNVLLISCLLQPLGPQPASGVGAAWWTEVNESEQNTRWTLAWPTTTCPPNSPEQLMLCLWWTLSLQAVLGCWRARARGFQGLPRPGSCLLPLHTPGADQACFYQILKCLRLSCWLEKMAVEQLRAEQANALQKQILWARKSLPLQEALVRISCLETNRSWHCPKKMIVVSYTVFLQRGR